MKHLRHFVLLLLLIFSCQFLFAQIKTANRLYAQLKYNKAIPFYLKTVNGKKDAYKKEATIKLADCYRLTNNHNLAVEWYEKAKVYIDSDLEVALNYGIVLRTMGRYNEASKYFEQYLAGNPENIEAKHYKDYCLQIEEWLKLPESAVYKNEKILNSKYSDFSPIPYKNGLVIVSDRMVDQLDNHNYSWTGNGYLDLYFSWHNDEGNLTTPVILSKTFNQSFHDGPVCFSPDWETAYITRTSKEKRYKKDSLQTHYSFITVVDLNQSKKNEKPFACNNREYSVGHASISPDGKTLIFASGNNNGFGASDLYMCKIKDGEWTEPENLGANINTFGKEYFPFLASETTLYFASDGHMGYGGLDIFVSEFKNGQWQKPENLKAPINSSYDDFGIMFLNSDSGYFSSDRPGGLGSDDIYNFTNFKLIPNP
ncbi:hypothetical protein [uncultured Draconibacterium sp.]|uniref:hypothetical protein n=1 Tax=uncultured Draconibacterium sp. TaxID=1573823 RepID=UPI003748FB33